MSSREEERYPTTSLTSSLMAKKVRWGEQVDNFDAVGGGCVASAGVAVQERGLESTGGVVETARQVWECVGIGLFTTSFALCCPTSLRVSVLAAESPYARSLSLMRGIFS